MTLQNKRPHRARRFAALLALATLSSSTSLRAEVPVTRTVAHLPVSNGHGAVMLDLSTARLTHFREHLFAGEEPLLDQAGQEVYKDGNPQTVHTRDLLYDAYFGLRVDGAQAWLTGDPVDLDASGYVPYKSGAVGGSGVMRMVQSRGSLELSTYVLSPRSLPHASFVLALSVRNTGGSSASGVSVFSLHNFHLGFGRPGVREDIGENGETVSFDANGGNNDLLERGFAGIVAARPLATVAHHGGSYGAAPAAENLFQIVAGGAPVDLPDLDAEAPVHDGSVSGFQFDLGDLAAGEERWVGIAFAHHGDPFAGATVQGWLDSYVGNKDAATLVADELSAWESFQQSLSVPPTTSGDDETLYRHSAVMLAMAQSQESHAYLREWLSADGEPRKTRFGTTLDGPAAALPATVAHRGHGAVLASLPPGEWTVSWIRDGAYAVAAMAGAGMHQQAKDGLAFYLRAESGRFQQWNELQPYNMPPYQISLVRYYGFGVEETDFNAFGPNLEFDGFGLFLWALQRYQKASGDSDFVSDNWALITSKVADALVALVDPSSGLLRADSSIWETHWKGRERHWAYTNITAARGLCDAASLAELMGDAAHASQYREAGKALRKAIAERLSDANHAIAANTEELASGQGYWDAAVVDAVAMELFDPKGTIAKATLAGLDANLAVPAGAGWARNDDRFDHMGGEDLSPWGSEYDSGEWVIVDMRGAVATWLGGDATRANRLSDWVRDQALANYLEVAEVFDEGNGKYKFNSPMVGFGAGAYMLARQVRDRPADPACGSYYDEPATGGGGNGGGGASAGGGGAGGVTTPGGNGADADSSCACRLEASTPNAPSPVWQWLGAALGLLLLVARRRR